MKLTVRADASPQMGTGHLMRCLSLAQGWKDTSGDAVFISFCKNDKLIQRIKKEGIKVYNLQHISDIEDTKKALKKENPEWVMLDGYHFGSDYQKEIKEAGYKLFVIDDYAHLEHYYADIILNQNYGAENFVYSAEPYTKLLLGTKYVLLRREFLEYLDYKRQIPDVAKKVLITMGGVDPENYTFKVLQATNLVDFPLDVKVVIGARNTHYKLIEKEANSCKHNMEILTNLDNMAPLMAWADVAVSAGGTTTWELAFMGLPSMLCIVADNQEYAVNALVKDEIFQSAGWIKNKPAEEISHMLTELICNKAVRDMMYGRAKTVVDEKGIYRVMDALKKEAFSPNSLSASLRRDIDFGEVKFANFINLSDNEKEMIRNWRNSDEIRKWMFTDHIISKEDHLNFIENLRKDGANFYWMVIADDKPIGVVSFQKVDFKNRSGYLGIYSTEKGIGRLIMKYLLHLWFELTQMRILKCEVLEGNKHAYNFYKNAGFMEEDIVRFIRKENINKKVILMSISGENMNKQFKTEYAQNR